MKINTCTDNAVRGVYLIKIVEFSGKCVADSNDHIKFRRNVDGYEWKIRFHPRQNPTNCIALQLVFLSEAGSNEVTARLSCRLVDPSGIVRPSVKIAASKSFQHHSDSSQLIMSRDNAYSSGYVKSGSLTMKCTITVFKGQKAIPLPSSDLHQHFGKLHESQVGADVTFTVDGESIMAHKNVLAARSPVFMAEFFGEMEEKASKCVQIKEMEAAVFKAMLGFIYTDKVPELDENSEEAVAMAQHLIVAADRYRLDRLKVICERRIAFSIEVGTAAATLALAEQDGCAQLKAKCIEFIAGGLSETLEAVLATEGYKDLVVSNPLLVTELLRAAHGRNKTTEE
ncbi:hypothetical protein ACP70R_032667 [Stipagrostis hirtigluma subsp. patula]